MPNLIIGHTYDISHPSFSITARLDRIYGKVGLGAYFTFIGPSGEEIHWTEIEASQLTFTPTPMQERNDA